VEFLPDSGHAVPSESGETMTRRPRRNHTPAFSARRLRGGLGTLTCNSGRILRTKVVFDCRCRSGGPLSATVCCHRVRSTIGVLPGIEPTGGQCRKLCAGVCIASCARSPSRSARCRRIMRGCGACAIRLYRNPPKTDIAFIARSASKSTLALSLCKVTNGTQYQGAGGTQSQCARQSV
jgi:hypothetical protein